MEPTYQECQALFIQAVSSAHHKMQVLLDVTCGDDWQDIETVVANFALAAASVRNRFEEMQA